MSLFHRIRARIHTFFHVDIPMFWDNRSLFGKISLVCFGTILAQFLLLGVVIGFSMLMSALNSNKTYKLQHPVEQIKSIEIVYIDDSVSLYSHPLDEIPEIVRQHTISVISLDDAAITECTNDLFALKEGTLYPILYRLED